MSTSHPPQGQEGEYTISIPPLPTSIPQLQSVITNSFTSGSLAQLTKSADADPALKAYTQRIRHNRQINALEGRNAHHCSTLIGTVYHNPTGEAVGLIILLAPPGRVPEGASAWGGKTRSLKPEGESSADADASEGDLWTDPVPEGGAAAVAKAARSTIDEERVSGRIMGEDRFREWWYVSTLAVVPGHQRKGLGGMLVRWGIEAARADAQARLQEEGQVGVKGIWLIAAEGAVRTYEREGFSRIENGWLGEQGNGGQEFTWCKMDF